MTQCPLHDKNYTCAASAASDYHEIRSGGTAADTNDTVTHALTTIVANKRCRSAWKRTRGSVTGYSEGSMPATTALCFTTSVDTSLATAGGPPRNSCRRARSLPSNWCSYFIDKAADATTPASRSSGTILASERAGRLVTPCPSIGSIRTVRASRELDEGHDDAK